MATTQDPTRRVRDFFGDEGARTLEPRQTVGRYRILGEIGRGGMAVVYEAHDPELRRTVAIKVLKDGPSERLRREALAAAKLRHPNVVTVHEVGPDYIVMERVGGETLARAAARLSPRERIEALEAVARAVAYAHGEGVVHRDLKPDNVLLEPSGRVVLTDFGLAKTLEPSQLTIAGAAVGTPHYMAPEQVRGDVDRIGPAADVWALGVMLYELVTGRRPFDGPNVPAIYDAIRKTEPPGLKGPLGAIAAHALEKDPARRYASAAALADDLRRHLAGDVVSVEPVGPLGRFARRARNRPASYAVAAAFVLAGALVLGLVAWGRAARGRVVEELRERARLSLEAALELRRAGAAYRMRQFLPPLAAAYQEAIARAPAIAEVEYLMGRMHRALLEEDKALRFQERALAKDPRFLPALYERALLLSLRHGRAFEGAAVALQGEKDKVPDRHEIEQLRPDLVRLRLSLTSAWEAYFAALPPKDADGPQARLGRGLAASAGGRHAEARAALDAAVKADPLLEEGWEALSRAVFADRQEDAAELERSWRAEEELLTERLGRDKGYVPHYLKRGFLRWTRGARRRHRGLDPLPDYDAATADFAAVIRLDPMNAEGWSHRGQVGVYRAIWKLERDQDPQPEIAAAVSDLTRAIEVDAKLWHAWLWRGNAHFYQGFYLARQGRNGEALAAFQPGDRDLSEAARLRPVDSTTLRWRGRLRAQLGAALGRAGRDPLATFAAGDADFVAAAPKNEDDAWLLMWWSTIASERALYRAARGEDPSADFDEAEHHLDQAIAAQRNQMETWKHRGLVYLARARHLEAQGRRAEARARYAAASADLHQALSLNPTLEIQFGATAREARKKSLALEDASSR